MACRKVEIRIIRLKDSLNISVQLENMDKKEIKTDIKEVKNEK